MSDNLLDRLKKKQASEGATGILPPDAPSRETTPEDTSPVPNEVIAKPVKAKRKKEDVPQEPEAVELAGFELFVDCLPVHGASVTPVTFEKIVAPFAAKVAEEGGVADLRFLKYGEGRARLGVLLRENLHTFPPVIIVTSMATYADVFLEVAIEHARLYVRALRG